MIFFVFTLIIAAITVMATTIAPTAVSATSSNNNTHMSNPVEAMDRLGKCLVIDDTDEKNDCYDQLLEDKYGSGS